MYTGAPTMRIENPMDRTAKKILKIVFILSVIYFPFGIETYQKGQERRQLKHEAIVAKTVLLDSGKRIKTEQFYKNGHCFINIQQYSSMSDGMFIDSPKQIIGKCKT